MIELICSKCRNVWWAVVILGLTDCPKCGCKETHVAHKKEDTT